MHSRFLQDLTGVLDWVGTLAFALSGGLLGVKKRFDLFGVLFLSFVVSAAGGMLRDVLIGAVPPVAITDIHYFAIAVIAGLITFYWYPRCGIASAANIAARRGWPWSVCSHWRTKGDRSWHQSSDGGDPGHADRNRRWNELVTSSPGISRLSYEAIFMRSPRSPVRRSYRSGRSPMCRRPILCYWAPPSVSSFG